MLPSPTKIEMWGRRLHKYHRCGETTDEALVTSTLSLPHPERLCRFLFMARQSKIDQFDRAGQSLVQVHVYVQEHLLDGRRKTLYTVNAGPPQILKFVFITYRLDLKEIYKCHKISVISLESMFSIDAVHDSWPLQGRT